MLFSEHIQYMQVKDNVKKNKVSTRGIKVNYYRINTMRVFSTYVLLLKLRYLAAGFQRLARNNHLYI